MLILGFQQKITCCEYGQYVIVYNPTYDKDEK